MFILIVYLLVNIIGNSGVWCVFASVRCDYLFVTFVTFCMYIPTE